jgi:hypothetical protein
MTAMTMRAMTEFVALDVTTTTSSALGQLKEIIHRLAKIIRSANEGMG